MLRQHDWKLCLRMVEGVHDKQSTPVNRSIVQGSVMVIELKQRVSSVKEMLQASLQ